MEEEEEVSLATAVEFIVKAQNMKPLDKPRLKHMVAVVKDHSVRTGLAASTIKKLAYRAVDSDSYDVTTRRHLLYSFVPERPEAFPYDIIPYIMSSIYPDAITNLRGAHSWPLAVLMWLASLLRYNILNTDNVYLRICYVPCFNMLQCFRFMRVCSEIVYDLTRREDVTPLRVIMLNKLKQKKGLVPPFTKLLRLFSTMRPDLIIVTTEGVVLPREVVLTPLMTTGLDACSRRHSGDDRDPEGHDQRLWTQCFKRQKLNPFARQTAVPVSKVIQYAATLEAKKAEHINVMQCSRLQHLISTIPSSDQWLWPNSAASLLHKPVLLLWFRPNDYKVYIELESWLDGALSSELLNERDNVVATVRSSDLLRLVTVYSEQLQLTGAMCSPVIQQFVLTHLMLWDQQQQIALMLRLLRCLGYIESFSSVVLSRLLPLLATAPMPVACAVVDTLADIAVNWCLLYCNNTGVLDDEGFAMVEGVLEISRQLDGPLIAAVLRCSGHPMMLHSVVRYYTTINNCCDALVLPLLLCPSPVLTAVLCCSGGAAVIHRLGALLEGLQDAYRRINVHFLDKGVYAEFCEDVLRETPQRNKAIELYTSCCYYATPFTTATDCWSELCSVFLGSDVAQQLQAMPRSRYTGSVVAGLHYAALWAGDGRAEALVGTYNKQEYQALRDEILQKLSDLGLIGLQDCIQTNIENDTIHESS